MSQIVCKNVVKIYRVAKRQPGLAGAVRGLFRRENTLVKALDEVSFSIKEGELVGYIGPNGAGKSTTIKILSGILAPDDGMVSVMGRNPWVERISTVAKIGVVFGQRTQLWWDLPVIESFDLLRRIYKIDLDEYRKQLDELVAILGIKDFLHVPVRQMSLGQRMRCDLVASLIHRPKIIFLDEPTIGLDAVAKLAIRDFVKKINQKNGVTVILTTHDMDDIESLCQRIMVLGRGKLLFDGSKTELRTAAGAKRNLRVDFAEEVRFSEDFGFNMEVVQHSSHSVTFSFDPNIVHPQKAIQLVSQKYSVKDLFVENPPIEELISTLYRELKI